MLRVIRTRIGVQLALVFVVVYLIAAVLVVFAVRESHRQTALRYAHDEARILADYSLAVHMYFTHELKPPLFEVTDGLLGPEYFEPSWMSSTYAVREMVAYFDELSDEGYYYKECAIDARSPENEADEVERQFIAECEKDPDLVESSGVRDIDGDTYYVLMRRAETMEESCLRCHSSPERAPGDLVDIYGPVRSFHREVGQVASVISIRIPIEEPYEQADIAAASLSIWLLGILVLGFFVLLAFTNSRVSAPLGLLRQRAVSILSREGDVSEPDPAGVSPRADEILELAKAMSAMSARIDTQMQALRDTNEDLIEANRVRSRFLANMSHELRTPLNSIIGFVGVVLQGMAGDLTEEQAKQLRMAHNSALHLHELVENVLDYSALEAGKASIEPTEFVMGDLVHWVVDPLGPEARAKGLELVVSGDLDQRVFSDRLRVGQILRNLVHNAIKFTDDGYVRVEAHARDAEVEITVSDTGIGIPADRIHEVFDEYTQIEDLREAKPRGTGLGLALVRAYARMLGGDVSVQSVHGKGSTFTLTLPRVLPGSGRDA